MSIESKEPIERLETRIQEAWKLGNLEVWRLGGLVEAFFESRKHLGSDIALTVHLKGCEAILKSDIS